MLGAYIVLRGIAVVVGLHLSGRNAGQGIYRLKTGIYRPSCEHTGECLHVNFGEGRVISQGQFRPFTYGKQFQKFTTKILLRCAFDVERSVEVHEHSVIDAHGLDKIFVVTKRVIAKEPKVIYGELRSPGNAGHDDRHMGMVEPNHPFR